MDIAVEVKGEKMPITINEMKMPNNCKECEFHQSGYPDWCDLSCRCRDVFNPSIRPDWCPLEETEPVRHGHWIEHHEPYTWMGYTYWSCSECGFECGYEKEITFRTNFCPNCGAKMSREEENKYEEPEINPCQGCEDYNGKGGCLSNGGCGERRKDAEIS